MPSNVQDIGESVAGKVMSSCLLGAYRLVREKDINQITTRIYIYTTIEALKGMKGNKDTSKVCKI